MVNVPVSHLNTLVYEYVCMYEYVKQPNDFTYSTSLFPYDLIIITEYVKEKVSFLSLSLTNFLDSNSVLNVKENSNTLTSTVYSYLWR